MDTQIPRFKTHICYVSKEPMPNLLLCFDQNLKPENVILLVSPEMTAKGKSLTRSFKEHNVKVAIENLPDTSYEALSSFIKEFILKLIEKSSADMSNYAFNLTGGTKLMTIAAFNACKDIMEMFYVDTFKNKLFLLGQPAEYPLSIQCEVQDIVNSYGFRIIEEKPKEFNRGKIITTLLDQPLSKIRIFNALAGQAVTTLFSTVNKKIFPTIKPLLKECEKANLLSLKGDDVVYKDEDSRFFCNGGWLEEHVQHALHQLQSYKLITDYKAGVEIKYDDNNDSNAQSKADNELDAVFVRNNILYLVECKTCKMNDVGKSRDIVYKLDSLHDKIGGVFARGILISFSPIEQKERRHLEKNNLIVIDAINEIKKLQETLTEKFNKK